MGIIGTEHISAFHTDRVHFRADRIGKSDPDQLTAVLDAQAALPGVQRMRDWANAALAVRLTEVAVDIGSGTGSEVIAFAQAVGSVGVAVGVDPNPAMNSIASERAAMAGVEAWFVKGTAYCLPFADASVDAVRCERVFQHLDDPGRAAEEIARVLVPGGRVVLIDSDWFTAIAHPGDPVVVQAMSEAMRQKSPNPGSGRRLRGLLVRAGLVIDDVGSEAVICDPGTATLMYELMSARAVMTGLITAQQRSTLLGDVAAGVDSGDFHLSVTMFAALAHKP